MAKQANESEHALTTSQQRVLDSMRSGISVVEAARAAGVGRSTV